MRLLDTTSLKLKEFIEANIPPYAILSHTWGAPHEEVSFQDMHLDPNTLEKDRKYGYSKIVNTCRLALKDGLEYVWVDTCCIDKSSSAELTEAINSMFRWYEKAVICYVYLADVKPQMHLEKGLKKCRWITRGWTLQELIAPRECRLFDSEWKHRGRKTNLKEMLAKLTRVPAPILAKEKSPRDYSVAQRMSWAAKRTTTRTEDVAYCLMGLFGIHMPMIYGEGDMAFHRLQEEILKRSDDPTIFTWWEPADGTPDLLSILASSPAPFQKSGDFMNPVGLRSSEFALTNRGVKIVNAPIIPFTARHTRKGKYLLVLDGGITKRDELAGICLRKVDGNLFCRIHKPMKVFSQLQLPRLSCRTVSEIYVADLCTLPITRSVILENRRSAVQILRPDDFRITDATPSRLWDYTDSCFLGGALDSSLVQWVKMTGVLRGQYVSLLILCDRRADNGCGEPVLSVIEKHWSVNDYYYLNRKAISQGELTWSEVEATDAALLHHTESTEIPLNHAVFKISVSVAKKMVSIREGNVQMYQAKVDIKREKRSSAKDGQSRR